MQVASTKEEELLLLKDTAAKEEATADKMHEQMGSSFAVRCLIQESLSAAYSRCSLYTCFLAICR